MIKKTKCILVADDDPAVCHLVADVFRTSEFHVLEASDGISALKLLDLSRAAIDVLLVDVVMPRLGGVELARVILSYHPSIKIIFISGHPDDVVERHGILTSKMRYLKKPFNPDVLKQTVCEELSK